MFAPVIAEVAEDQRVGSGEISAMPTRKLQKIDEHGERVDGIVKATLEHSRDTFRELRKVGVDELADEVLNLAYRGTRASDEKFNIAPGQASHRSRPYYWTSTVSNRPCAINRRAKSSPKVFTRDGGQIPRAGVAQRKGSRARHRT